MSSAQLLTSTREVKAVVGEPEVVEDTTAWSELKAACEAIAAMQVKDGSLAPEADAGAAGAELERAVTAIEALAPSFPHDAAYLDALVVDLRRWADHGFGVPDFLDSLVAFDPQNQREDGVRHLVVFPMYTQNGSPNRHLEAVLVEVIWPEFIDTLEREYENPLFVPLRFVDFTSGYDTNSAVLFTETVATRETPVFTWGAIFQDREAARYRRVVSEAARITKLELPSGAQAMLEDQSLTEATFIMWDLIHDRSHMRGDLPFDPFMIKQRMPYFLYSLEELRCDLTAFRHCVDLERRLGERVVAGENLTAVERDTLTHARGVQYAVLLDRIFRFALTGGRVRNYDGLGGQLLLAWLHQRGVMNWTDSKLTVEWSRLPACIIELADAVDELYWRSIDRPKVAHWLAAYELIRSVLTPHPASVWARGLPDEVLAGPPKGYTDAVLDDEFPLSMFFEALERKMAPVIASTRGITGRDD